MANKIDGPRYVYTPPTVVDHNMEKRTSVDLKSALPNIKVAERNDTDVKVTSTFQKIVIFFLLILSFFKSNDSKLEPARFSVGISAFNPAYIPAHDEDCDGAEKINPYDDNDHPDTMDAQPYRYVVIAQQRD